MAKPTQCPIDQTELMTTTLLDWLLPWSGLALAVVVYALLRYGLSLLVRRSGHFVGNPLLTPRLFSLLGALAFCVLAADWSADAEILRLSQLHWLSEALQVLTVLFGGMLVAHLLSAAATLYQSTEIGSRMSLRSYVQLAMIAIYALTALAAAVVATGQPVGYYLSGVGAILAVLLLVFRDTILAFASTLQAQSVDAFRPGDWIEVPQYGADGEIVEIALHSLKVQNWDKTISIVPMAHILDTGLKNWRGMSDSGGRRIKRSVRIDMTAARFLTDAEVERFSKFQLLQGYMASRLQELATHNKNAGGDTVYVRRLTNLGTFRAYVLAYLKAHPELDTDKFTCLVRQLQPGPEGLPLEIYVFCNTTDWEAYERIQSDVMDHLLAIMPEFDLRPFQNGLLEGLAKQGVPLYRAPEN